MLLWSIQLDREGGSFLNLVVTMFVGEISVVLFYCAGQLCSLSTTVRDYSRQSVEQECHY